MRNTYCSARTTCRGVETVSILQLTAPLLPFHNCKEKHAFTFCHTPATCFTIFRFLNKYHLSPQFHPKLPICLCFRAIVPISTRLLLGLCGDRYLKGPGVPCIKAVHTLTGNHYALWGQLRRKEQSVNRRRGKQEEEAGRRERPREPWPDSAGEVI